MGGQTGRGGGRNREQMSKVGGRTGDQGGRGDHISNQGIKGSRDDNAIDDIIQEDDKNANVGNGRNRPMVQGSCGLEGFRSWGVVGSDENGGTSVEEGYKGFGGKTIEQCTIQPPGFEDPGYPDKVYKVVKAHYGLHQAPRAWYETLANYLLENGFQRGKIDQTLFIKKRKGNILLVQVYVDDIIFGSTNKELYVKSASTPIKTKKPFLKDPDGEDVDVHIYRSKIGSWMYLTSSRPDIMFAVCACA
nr:hypothetical protein [Tanacetum cinerariifolium]